MDEAETFTARRLSLRRGEALREGARDGLPIALGYFAVSFTLGIAAKRAGLTASQGFLASLLCNASAGEYAGFTMISASAALWELAIMTLIVNARYLLMSTALSQKFAPGTPFIHRLLVGFDVTDELFGIAIARPGYLDPYYFYGAMLVAMPGWAFGTFFGVMAGNVLPTRLVSALSVALYGMFIAIVVPQMKASRANTIAVAIAVACSLAFHYVPALRGVSVGFAIILCAIAASLIAAIAFPVKEAENAH